MRRLRVVLAFGALCAVLGSAAIGFLAGERYALDGLVILHAAPGDLAAAMRKDEFYADYNERTLIVRGVVTSISADGPAAVLSFETQDPYATRCSLDRYPAVKTGDTVSVLAPGATAQRLTQGVLLTRCELLGS